MIFLMLHQEIRFTFKGGRFYDSGREHRGQRRHPERDARVPAAARTQRPRPQGNAAGPRVFQPRSTFLPRLVKREFYLK
jgi:hypothetical protein